MRLDARTLRLLALAGLVVALGARLWADSRAGFDRYGRLATFPGKTVVPCPPQDARTAVILAMGQSNIANEMEPPAGNEPTPGVFAFYDGACTEARAPLLGASGAGGEWLTRLGAALIRSGRYDKVVVAPAAIGGQPIARFATGDLGDMLDETVAALTARYRVTHGLWHQGESDYAQGTDPQEYRRLFLVILRRLRDRGVDAPVFVSTTTFCPPMAPWASDNPIQKAQKALPDEALGVWPGVDSDAFDQAASRFDGCHLSRLGQEWAAEAEAKAIAAYDARVSAR